MATINSTKIFATAPVGSSAPDSITLGGGSLWVEYGNGADSTGRGGDSTIVQYSLTGQTQHTYIVAGAADGLKIDPRTGAVWVLQNQDANSMLTLIDPGTGRISSALSYAPPYVYGANSTEGFDDVVFDGSKVFMSETNPANPGDPIVVSLNNGHDPFGKLFTTPILRSGDTGTNLATGQKNQPLPVSDPDSMKLLSNGDLLLTSGDDGALTFISHPGAVNQSESFITLTGLPSGVAPGLDDAIMPTSSSGTFYVTDTKTNLVEKVQVSGLNTKDIYASVASLGAVAQIDPTTGKATPFITGLSSPHGLVFVPSHVSTSKPSSVPTPAPESATPSPGRMTPTVDSVKIFTAAPTGSSAPDSITPGGGSVWVAYGNGADSAGKSGHSTIVQYNLIGQTEHIYSIAGSADGLKIDPLTGTVWALQNQDGNSTLSLIDPCTNQVSPTLSHAPPYVYGANSTEGFDDVVFDGHRVFMSETNPANPGDPIVVVLDNGQVPFGKLFTTPILRFGDTGTNLATGQKDQPLPVSDPDSMKLLSNGDLLLTGGDDGGLTFISHPGGINQSESFIKLTGLPSVVPPGLDDAIMPTSSSGTFYVTDTKTNLVEKVHVSGLNTKDIYASVAGLGAVAQIDPATGKATPFITGLSSPHGLVFVPSAASPSATASDLFSKLHGAMSAADLIPPVSGTQIASALSNDAGASASIQQQPNTAGGLPSPLPSSAQQSPWIDSSTHDSFAF